MCWHQLLFLGRTYDIMSQQDVTLEANKAAGRTTTCEPTNVHADRQHACLLGTFKALLEYPMFARLFLHHALCNFALQLHACNPTHCNFASKVFGSKTLRVHAHKIQTAGSVHAV
jgi:hypothetical protein